MFLRKKKHSSYFDLRQGGLEEQITATLFEMGSFSKHEMPSFLAVFTGMLYARRAAVRNYVQHNGENALIDALADTMNEMSGNLKHSNIFYWGVSNGYNMRESAMFSVFPICVSITKMVFDYTTYLMYTMKALKIDDQGFNGEYVLDYELEPWVSKAVKRMKIDVSRNAPVVEKSYLHSPIWQYERIKLHSEQCELCRALLDAENNSAYVERFAAE